MLMKVAEKRIAFAKKLKVKAEDALTKAEENFADVLTDIDDQAVALELRANQLRSLVAKERD